MRAGRYDRNWPADGGCCAVTQPVGAVRPMAAITPMVVTTPRARVRMSLMPPRSASERGITLTGAGQAKLSSASSLNRVRHERVGCDHSDVLSAALASIRHRIGVDDAIELRHPQLRARFRVERPEATVVGRTDENKASSGHRRTCASAAAGVLP